MMKGTRGRVCLAALGALALMAAIPGAAWGTSCPGANPCPYIGTPTVLGSYGVSYFNSQAGVAVDSSGDEYLSDWNNNRVIKLDSSGHQLWAVGAGNASGQSGNGPDQFNHPYELRLSADGTKLYVADGYNGRIDELNSSDGSFVRDWTGDGTTSFNLPVGVGVDPVNGDVYVTDYYNDRVEEFDPSGNFIAAFGWGVTDGVSSFEVCTSSCRAGIAGNGSGQFNAPIGVVINSSHDVYVSEQNNNRIQEFGPGPSFTPTAVSAPGLLSQPYGLALDGSGNLLVADANHNEIQRLGSSLAFQESFGWGVSDGIAQSESCTSSCNPGISGSGDAQFHYPEDIAVDSLGNLHIADDGNSREQTLTSAGTYVTKIVSPGFTSLRLNEADRILSTPSGNMWVSDGLNQRVLELSPTGTILNKIGANGGDGAPGGSSGATGADGIGLSQPFDLAFDPSGNLWVADAGNNRVAEFNSNGGFIKTIGWGVSDGAAQLEVCTVNCRAGLAGSGNGEFNFDQGLAIDSSGNLYVGDTDNCRVQELSSSGVFITRWGESGGNGFCGSGPGQFESPVSISIDRSGNVWVADFDTSYIQEFTPTGAYLRTVGGPGTIGGTFDGPQQLAFDSFGDLLVADTSNDRAQVLDPLNGSYGFAWGGPSGVVPGPGDFGSVGGVAVLPDDEVVVSDQNGGRIELFTFAAPAVSSPASSPAALDAALSGTVDPGGGVAAYRFLWGPTSSYGRVSPAGATGPATSAQTVGATLNGLASDTTYHWQLVASTPAGISTTADQVFTTTPFGTGPAGPPGAGGAQGSTGGAGATGLQGPAGNPGPAGAPGRNAVVKCAKPKLKGRKVTEKCTLTLVLPAVAHVWLRLSRGNRVYATAHTITGRGGRRSLRLSLRRALTGDRYKLTVLVARPGIRTRAFTWTVTL